MQVIRGTTRQDAQNLTKRAEGTKQSLQRPECGSRLSFKEMAEGGREWGELEVGPVSAP